jgi:hypothetical protein
VTRIDSQSNADDEHRCLSVAASLPLSWIAQEGYPCLLSRGAPDSLVHYRTATVHVRCAISFQFWRSRPLQICDSLAHQTLSGVHRIVQCPLPAVGAGHASPVDCVADRCAGGRWLTGQSGAPSDSPVNYSRTLPNSPESGLFTGVQPGAPGTVRCTTG